MDSIPQRLVAALADKYRLERELGVGGTATVYLAEDLKHHRRVAIKVLKPQVAAALGPERFEDEIRMAAGLHHPHILGMYDSGEADGFLYYVMPFVEGHSLRERLQRHDPIPFPYVAKLMAEVADALAHAHAAGIVHRDIKPENILLAGKHIVVTDFGIAKAITDAAERKSSTSLGMALGTPAYMAPEQAAADPNLDHRADLYALGVVGYEMLAGKPPFDGSSQEMLAKHLSATPEPVANLRPGVPAALAAVVMRALAKNPNERWKDADAMQAQLEPLTGTTSNSGLVATVALAARRRLPTRRLLFGALGLVAIGLAAWLVWGPPPSPGGYAPRNAPLAAAPGDAPAIAQTAPTIPDLAKDPSIAVLPFQNMSSDAEQAYFSDGVSEELLNLLAKIPELRVVARTSSFMYRDGKTSIPDIGKALKVAAVLEGSVRRSGDKVRITAQLIRASDGTHLWSETYDRTLDDVFAVQDEIATTVVDKLKLTLLAKAPAAHQMDPALYPLLLQAEALSGNGSKAGRAQGLVLFKKIIAADPESARGWLGTARNYLNQATFLEMPMEEGKRLAREAAERALSLDPTLGTAHGYIGSIHLLDGDTAAGAAAYERALAVSPNEPRVLGNTTRLLLRLGRVEDTVRVQRWYTAHDPASGNSQIALALYELMAGNLEAAEAAARSAMLLTPDLAYGHVTLAEILFHAGKHAECLAEAGPSTRGKWAPQRPMRREATPTGRSSGSIAHLLRTTSK
jgi:TolB-like protein/tRNA A-37 threonylcarbamoyl transferase component Bud32